MVELSMHCILRLSEGAQPYLDKSMSLRGPDPTEGGIAARPRPAKDGQPYPLQGGQHVVLSLPRDSGCDVIASLPR